MLVDNGIEIHGINRHCMLQHGFKISAVAYNGDLESVLTSQNSAV
jgi:hypothetical protein